MCKSVVPGDILRPHLENELHHLGVDQPVDRLSVHMGDEVTGAQSRFLGGAFVLHVLRLDAKTNGTNGRVEEPTGNLPGGETSRIEPP